jgi:hypothetical protein
MSRRGARLQDADARRLQDGSRNTCGTGTSCMHGTFSICHQIGTPRGFRQAQPRSPARWHGRDDTWSAPRAARSRGRGRVKTPPSMREAGAAGMARPRLPPPSRPPARRGPPRRRAHDARTVPAIGSAGIFPCRWGSSAGPGARQPGPIGPRRGCRRQRIGGRPRSLSRPLGRPLGGPLISLMFFDAYVRCKSDGLF